MRRFLVYCKLISLVFLCSACGSFKTLVKRGHKPHLAKRTFTITTEDCSEIVCQASNSLLHKSIKKEIISYYESRGLKYSKDPHAAGVHFHLISTFEGKEVGHYQRNLYLVANGKQGELFQIGLSDAFSTPLHDGFDNLHKAQDQFLALVKETDIMPSYVAKK